MSVMACNRKGCPNVLCDRHSRTYGNICYDCFEELCSLNITKESQIVDFMNTAKSEFDETPMSRRDKLERIFPILV